MGSRVVIDIERLVVDADNHRCRLILDGDKVRLRAQHCSMEVRCSPNNGPATLVFLWQRCARMYVPAVRRKMIIGIGRTELLQ